MPRIEIELENKIVRSPRVKQVEGLFDLPAAHSSQNNWVVDWPLDEPGARPWNIGLVVGPSGAGKSTFIRKVFPGEIVTSFDWPTDRSVVDGFPANCSVKQIVELLSAVGFSSPPSWLRPFSHLSNGEQFRVTLARALAQGRPRLVIDEFTSVVDRTVARIGSAALAKGVRRRNGQFVAVTCHYDVIDWLDPDWIFEPMPTTDGKPAGRFSWRSLRGRPTINMEVRRAKRNLWQLFRHHHYLNHDLAGSAQCFVGRIDQTPACFSAVLPFPHPRRPGWREHRTVCLPDFQGVGIGNAMSDLLASIYSATGKPYRSVTSHPSMITSRAKSKYWRMTRGPSRLAKQRFGGFAPSNSSRRYTASFEYVGPRNNVLARELGLIHS